MSLDLRDRILDVPDFPTEGIVFKDVMPLLADREYLAESIRQLADWARPREPNLILGAEARGFIFGGALAYELGAGFVAARKPGKLPAGNGRSDVRARVRDGQPAGAPRRVRSRSARHRPRRRSRDRRHGQAKVELVEGLGGTVAGALFVIELTFLNGRDRLEGYDVHSLIQY